VVRPPLRHEQLYRAGRAQGTGSSSSAPTSAQHAAGERAAGAARHRHGRAGRAALLTARTPRQWSSPWPHGRRGAAALRGAALDQQSWSSAHPAESLAIAGQVSRALVDVVRAVRAAAPLRFVLAKGGITSSDVATEGLTIRRAEVIGQLFPGMVSVWLPQTARPTPASARRVRRERRRDVRACRSCLAAATALGISPLSQRSRSNSCVTH